MKPEKPILFSGPMVRAILENRKTQTRRIVKGAALQWLTESGFSPEFVALPENALCPYGAPGYRLWVKEIHWRLGKWVRNGVTKTGRQKWRFRAESNAPSSVCFEAPHAKPARTLVGWHKRPSIFMPRWASRITIEITAVRVERLQDISEEDAVAEGIYREGRCWIAPGTSQSFNRNNPEWDTTPIRAFAHLWRSINGPDSWNANPWVWVVEFKRIQP